VGARPGRQRGAAGAVDLPSILGGRRGPALARRRAGRGCGCGLRGGRWR
jgi:hypothetical protein